MISKDTQLYISIAERPGNFGTTVFNAAFRAVKIDAIYKACQVKPSDLAAAIQGVRALGIAGCSVTMPFKQAVLPYLDVIDPLAAKIGAVNTIVNKDGKLVGYNTDYEGALAVLWRIPKRQRQRVLLLGDGGVAQAIAAALLALHASDVIVASREARPGRSFVKKWKFARWIPWTKRGSVASDLLINATPVGMAPKSDDCPMPLRCLPDLAWVMDVVVSPPKTRLTKEARKRGVGVIAGYQMSLAGAMGQFELYTNRRAPRAVMAWAARRLIL